MYICINISTNIRKLYTFTSTAYKYKCKPPAALKFNLLTYMYNTYVQLSGRVQFKQKKFVAVM